MRSIGNRKSPSATYLNLDFNSIVQILTCKFERPAKAGRTQSVNLVKDYADHECQDEGCDHTHGTDAGSDDDHEDTEASTAADDYMDTKTDEITTKAKMNTRHQRRKAAEEKARQAADEWGLEFYADIEEHDRRVKAEVEQKLIERRRRDELLASQSCKEIPCRDVKSQKPGDGESTTGNTTNDQDDKQPHGDDGSVSESGSASAEVSSDLRMRCFNCCKIGHSYKLCPEPTRTLESCPCLGCALDADGKPAGCCVLVKRTGDPNGERNQKHEARDG